MRKGNKVYAEGQLRAREYEARDGQKRTALELRFARVVNLERRPREEGSFAGSEGSYGDAPPQVKPRGAEARSSAPGAEMDVDDIPF
jgi:single-stranded DNA-binding protein